MLGDIVELAKLAREVVMSPRAKVNGWRQFLKLYHSLDDVIDASHLVLEHYFLVPLNAPFLTGTRSYKSPLDKWVSVTNKDFKKLDEAVVAFIKSYDQLVRILEIFDKDLSKRINYHFGVKSWWCSVIADAYCGGRITPDGKTLQRTAFRLEKAIPAARYGPAMCGGDAAEKLAEKEAVDISQNEVKERLVEVGRQNLEAMRGIKSDLAAFIRNHCRIEDVL